MDKYISLESLMDFPIRADRCDKKHANEDFIFGIESVMEYARNHSTDDVVQVVHGQWILHHTVTGSPYTECSHCCTDFAFKTDRGTLAKLDMRGMPYCPRCGAKMDGGV